MNDLGYLFTNTTSMINTAKAAKRTLDMNILSLIVKVKAKYGSVRAHRTK